MSDILNRIRNPLFKVPGSRFMSQGGGITGIPNNMSMRPENMSMRPENMSINPNLNLSLGNSSFNDINPEDAKKIGEAVISEGLFTKTKPDVSSLATDNKEKVDSNLTGLYDGSGDISKIMGALTKLSEDDSADKMYQKLINKKTTPEDAKAEVNKFFGVAKEEKTPAWADAALAIGASLLKQPKAGETPLQTLGTAFAAGGVAAKAKKKEERGEDLAMNKLAFGVFRENEKARKALATKYATYKENKVKNTTELGIKLTNMLFDREKFDATQKKDIADTITKTVNTFPKEIRGDLFTAFEKDKNYFKNIPIDQIPQHIYALAEENGIDLDNVEPSAIVKNDIKINTQEQYDQYKELYPNLGWGESFDNTKTYTMQGFKNKLTDDLFTTTPNLLIEGAKQKSGFLALLDRRNQLMKITNPDDDVTAELAIINQKIEKDTKVPSDLTNLQKQQRALAGLEQEKRSVQMGGPGRSLDVINREIVETRGRINKLVTTEKTAVYMSKDGSLYSGPVGPGGLDEIKNQATIKDLEQRKVNFVRAAYIGDRILQNLAKPIGDKQLGLFARVGNAILNVQTQIGNFSAMGEEALKRYDGSTRSLDEIIANPTGENPEFTKKVFADFKEAVKGDQRLASAVLDYAYALAGSRETGKLTDKDVAQSLNTLGGRSIAEGDFFTNKEKVIQGVSAALDLAHNNLGTSVNLFLDKSYKMELKRDPNTTRDNFRFDAQALIKNISPDPDLYKRIRIGKTDFSSHGLGYQSFDKYQKLMAPETSSNIPKNEIVGSTDAISTVANQIKNIGNTLEVLQSIGSSDPKVLERIKKLKDESETLINGLNPKDKTEVRKLLGLE